MLLHYWRQHHLEDVVTIPAELLTPALGLAVQGSTISGAKNLAHQGAKENTSVDFTFRARKL